MGIMERYSVFFFNVFSIQQTRAIPALLVVLRSCLLTLHMQCKNYYNKDHLKEY